MSSSGTHLGRGGEQAPRPPPAGAEVAAPGIPPRPSLPAAATAALTRHRAKDGACGRPRSVRARPSRLKGLRSLRDGLRPPLTPETSANPDGQLAGRRGLPFLSRGEGGSVRWSGGDPE